MKTLGRTRELCPICKNCGRRHATGLINPDHQGLPIADLLEDRRGSDLPKRSGQSGRPGLGRPSQKPQSDKRGGLKGSMQHWLAVYPPGFESPTFFVAVD